MEKMPRQNETGGNDRGSDPNFHEVSENRKELRKALIELGGKGVVFDKHYKKSLEEVQEQASEFKVTDFGGLKEAKEVLKKQKAEHDAGILKDGVSIDYEAILEETPEISKVRRTMENIVDLKDFRMRRMFEILSPKTSLSTKKRNEAVLKTIKEEIEVGEKELEQSDPSVLRQTELLEYKENLGTIKQMVLGISSFLNNSLGFQRFHLGENEDKILTPNLQVCNGSHGDTSGV